MSTEIREYLHDHSERADWPRGEWDSEPDKIQWVDETTNLDCLMHRNRMGAWCGYVGVPEGHQFFATPYDSLHVDVHGGLTYADFCQESTDEAKGVCHVPFEGRPHRVWWLGFDCAHYMDSCPGMDASNIRMGWGIDSEGYYKNRQYVEREVRSLAAQLAIRSTPSEHDET